ncbi:MAG TPA: hypothetical protein PKD51_18975 [Saprospiraceae bacterium]|mgnify:CR=1 FL=1|nr:hypothetical protein [Saprospiraceae bacterium]
MKHLIFIISLFSLVLWNLACTKESMETERKQTPCIDQTIVYEEIGRFGANKVWHANSNSTDNALTGQPREHLIFNNAKIQYQKFTPTGEDPFSYLGVYHWPYIMEVLFDNDSIGVHKVSVPYVNGDGFTYYPVLADNLLKSDHPAYMVAYKVNRAVKFTNGYRNQQIELKTYDMEYDGVFIQNFAYTPMTKLSNVPNFGHKH